MLRVELKVLEGSQAGKVIPLNVRQFLIGREQDCHLRPNSELVSRHHCVFAIDDFSVRLRDLGSTNGTFLNGERLKGQAVLKAGDKVVVGKLAFEVSIQLSPATAPVAEPEAPDNTAVVDEAAQNAATIEFGAITQAEDTAMFPQSETAVPPPVSLPPGFNPQLAYPPMPYGMPPAGYGMPGYPPQAYPPVGYPPQYAPVPGMGYMPGYPMPQMMPGYSMPGMAPPPAAPVAPAEDPAAKKGARNQVEA
ncbi:MAG: FHA domain-containing protein, partial [Planctomycetaceae bacterium]